MERFRILQVIGEGTYGKVFKAQERESGRVVAIKKFKQREDEDPHVRKTMMREIRVLKEFRHTNIVHLRQVFREKGKLYLIFDYVPKTLLEELQAAPSGLPFDKIKFIIYQILKANNFLHESRIMHRDIKPENLLISKHGIVKLCDFGFARQLNSSSTFQYTDYVSTRWYRAPELLVGDANYEGGVDVWAIGCIFAEIYNGMPLFPGDSDLHTLQLILETISADDMQNDRPVQELSKKQRVAFRLNPLFESMKVPTAESLLHNPETANEVSLQALLKDINDEQLDFIRRCLTIDSSKRATLAELLEHPVFDEDFKAGFDAQIEERKQEDEAEMTRLQELTLKTKDGRLELDPEELVTEEERDEEDDEDEFDDDNSSSAVGSPGSSSEQTPAGSSSGVDANKIHSMNMNVIGIVEERNHANSKQSLNVGQGLLLDRESEATSAERALPLPGATDSDTNNKASSSGDGAGVSAGQSGSSDPITGSSRDPKDKRKIDASTGSPLDEEQESTREEQTPATDLITTPEESKDQQPQQLQIKQGVNGTASLELMGTEVGTPQAQRSSLLEKAEDLQQQDVASSQHRDVASIDDSIELQKPAQISVQVQGQVVEMMPEAPAESVGSDAAASPPQSMKTTLAQQQANKRTSLNHYMIESSITEEIREENASEKSDSDKTNSGKKTTGQFSQLVAKEQSLSKFGKQERRKLAEGPSEEVVHEEDGNGSSSSQKENQQQRINADCKKDANKDPKRAGATSPNFAANTELINNFTDSKLSSNELRPSAAGSKGSRGSRNAPSSQGSRPNRAHTETTTVHPVKLPGELEGSLTHPEQAASQQVIHVVRQAESSLDAKAKSGQPPSIRKVNINFGASQETKVYVQNSLMFAQMNTMGAKNAFQTDGAQTSILASQVVSANPDSDAQYGTQSSRQTNGITSSGQPPAERSVSKGASNQTARDGTPGKKYSMATPQQTNGLHLFSVEGSGFKQLTATNGLDSTAAKTTLTNGLNGQSSSNAAFALQEMSVTHFGGKPIYKLQQYPQTQVKAGGPKQAAILKQTASLEKLEKRGYTPQKLPNLKAIHSSMSQYHQKNGLVKPPATGEQPRIGEGLINIAPQQVSNRLAQNSISNHFSSYQQQNKTTPQQQAAGNQAAQSKLVSGSTHSLNPKMNFTHQNYHRPSNSQTNEVPGGRKHNSLASNATGTLAAQNSMSKKSQQIQPLKLVAFPKLSTDEGTAVASPTSHQLTGLPANAQTLSSGIAQKQKFAGKPKATPVQKKAPNQVLLMNQQQQLHGRAQGQKMPKRYSDMGMGPQNSLGAASHGPPVAASCNSSIQNVSQQPNKFVNPSQLARYGDRAVQNFHPATLTNEYMLSQESIVFNEANSRPSRQSSKQFENLQQQQAQQHSSVENSRQALVEPQRSMQAKSRSNAHGPMNATNPLVANQTTFHSTMKSQNARFTRQEHQQTSVSRPEDKYPSMTSSVNNYNLVVKADSGTQGSSRRQADLEYAQVRNQMSENTRLTSHLKSSNAAAVSRTKDDSVSASKALNQSGAKSLHSGNKQTTMTSLFSKSKFFQSHQNTESKPPQQPGYPSQNAPLSFSQQHAQLQNSSAQQPAEGTHFSEKDQFPKRNITNKLRNANNQPHKNKKYANDTASPSPISHTQHPGGAHSHTKNIVLPNLSGAQHGITPASQALQGSLTQLRVANQITAQDAAPAGPYKANLSQSPNINSTKEVQLNTAPGSIVQLNASEFNLRLTNNSNLGATPGGPGNQPQLHYQQIVRKPPSVIQPARAQQYSMYLTPSQNYTSSSQTGGHLAASRTTMMQKQIQAKLKHKHSTGDIGGKSPGGAGPAAGALNKRMASHVHEGSLHVHNSKVLMQGGGPTNRSPVINGSTVSFKVKTETDWHRGSQNQLIDVGPLATGQGVNQLYRVSNQVLEKSISPQRIQQAIKRGSNAAMLNSQGGHGGGSIAMIGGSLASEISQKRQGQQQSEKSRRETSQPGTAHHLSGFMNESSQDSLPVQSPNLLRKKFVSKQAAGAQ